MKLRVVRKASFTTVSNNCLRTQKLSLKAKGLLVLMMSLPDNWDYSVAGLVALCQEGEFAVEAALKELKREHYLVVKKLYPGETESGRFEYEYIVSDEAQSEAQENAEPELQGGCKQGVENRPLDIYKNKIKKTKERDIIYPPINTPTETASDDAAPAAPKGGVSETIKTVISYLNEKTGKRFSPKSAMAVRHITARLKEGYALEDFKTVMDRKVAAWKGDERMAQYLRPETLFGSKFDGYLNEVTAPKSYKAVKSETYDYAEWERTHDEFGNPIGDTR